jgi:hypothetical protein
MNLKIALLLFSLSHLVHGYLRAGKSDFSDPLEIRDLKLISNDDNIVKDPLGYNIEFEPKSLSLPKQDYSIWNYFWGPSLEEIIISFKNSATGEIENTHHDV